MADKIKFTFDPITRYEYDDGQWKLDAPHANETLAVVDGDVILTKTFADRIKTVIYKVTKDASIYVEKSETFTTLDGTALSSSTAHASSGHDDEDGEDGEDSEDGQDDHGDGAENYDGSEDDDFRDGGLGNDDLDGGAGDDELWGGDGDDIIRGGFGLDVLLGEVGNDDLDGGEGHDDLDGGDGDDALLGGIGDDSLTGGSGADDLNGGVGNDYLYAGSGNDSVDGGDGDDTIVGGDGAGDDSYTGGAGIDTIKYASSKAGIIVNLSSGVARSISGNKAGIGQDSLTSIENVIAGSYADSLYGNADANSLSGEKGNDLLQGGLGDDTLDGGDGVDTADYSDKTAAVVVELNGSTAAQVEVNGVAEDSIKNIENITTGSGDDIVTGDASANKLYGGAGNDQLTGGAGNDELDGGSGIDTADYSDKTNKVEVTLNGSKAAKVKVNGKFEDSIKDIENLIGGSGDDVLVGDSNVNELVGGGGNDLLKGGAGNDSLTGGAGSDKFAFDTKLKAGANLDTITDFNDAEDLIALSKSIFGSLKKGVTAEHLVAGTTGELASHVYDTNDYLRFDTTEHKLYYDADGSGTKYQAVAIAELTGVSSLQASDFIIV